MNECVAMGAGWGILPTVDWRSGRMKIEEIKKRVMKFDYGPGITTEFHLRREEFETLLQRIAELEADLNREMTYKEALERAEANLRKLKEAVRERRNSISNYRGNEDNQLYAVLDELEKEGK